MIDEGYIKYNCRWEKDEPLLPHKWMELNTYRNRLYNLGLIGAYPDSGIGFGNVSIRDTDNPLNFIITGTRTGRLKELGPMHYTMVEAFDFEANTVSCRGPIEASSEALTHAMIYQLGRGLYDAVIHVHSLEMWEKLLFKIPTTSKNVGYGTPEMAFEVERLFTHGKLKEEKILAMAGHDEGIITFGKDLGQAFEILICFLT